METYELKADIAVLCVQARSFPDGILEAYQELEAADPSIPQRTFYGISYPGPGGQIVYKAAAAEIDPGEAARFGLERFVISHGTYMTETLHNFMEDPSVFGRAFDRLLKTPGLDRFPCIEWYKNDREVLCMVKLRHPQG